MIQPHTVVWLNEAQLYLLGPDSNMAERVAARLRALLSNSTRGPILVLVTLWPEYWNTLTSLPTEPAADTYAQQRELLTTLGAHCSVPATFTHRDIERLSELSERDQRLRLAATHAVDNEIVQYLAGAPFLASRYDNAPAPARAVLDAAIALRGLGHDRVLPSELLAAAAEGYFTQSQWDRLREDWFEEALSYCTQKGHGVLAPLTVIRPRTGGAAVAAYRLADYLEDYGNHHLVPPASVWTAAAEHGSDPASLITLASAAQRRWRLRYAHDLTRAALAQGQSDAVIHLALSQATTGDVLGIQRTKALAVQHGADLTPVLDILEEPSDIETLYRQAVAKVDIPAMLTLAPRRIGVGGDVPGVETFATQALTKGNTQALRYLAGTRQKAGDVSGAETFYRQAIGLGTDPAAARELALMLSHMGERAQAKALLVQAAEQGDAPALQVLAAWSADEGDWDAAEGFASQSAERGQPAALHQLTLRRMGRGETGEAERLAHRTNDFGDPAALRALATHYRVQENLIKSEELYRCAIENSDAESMQYLAEILDDTGNVAEAESLAQQAAQNGRPWGLHRMANARQHAGQPAEAERLGIMALESGHALILIALTEEAARAENHAEAQRLATLAAQRGNTEIHRFLARFHDSKGEHAAADQYAQQAIRLGDREVLREMAGIRRRAGNIAGAQDLADRAATMGDPGILYILATRIDEQGDSVAAERLAIRAANFGDPSALQHLATAHPDDPRWQRIHRFGLDADGHPFAPW